MHSLEVGGLWGWIGLDWTGGGLDWVGVFNLLGERQEAGASPLECGDVWFPGVTGWDFANAAIGCECREGRQIEEQPADCQCRGDVAVAQACLWRSRVPGRRQC